MTGRNFYDAGIDRAAHLRPDDDWIAERLSDPTTRIVPMWRTRNLVIGGESPRAVVLSVAEAGAVLAQAAHAVLLGVIDEITYFGIDLSDIETPEQHLPLGTDAEFTDLRQVGALLSRDEGALLAYSRGILHWHRTHRFCGWCGSPTESRFGGHMRSCTNPDCATEHFPRTDPAIIVVVANGDRALLGRKAEWPEGMYSALAGFVEPGESLEHAVRREVMEEVGVALTEITYQSSQPWPFPASLMVGFHAETEATEFAICDNELEDARWFSRNELLNRRDLAFGRARPRGDSIARRLIDDWLNNR